MPFCLTSEPTTPLSTKPHWSSNSFRLLGYALENMASIVQECESVLVPSLVFPEIGGES